jgi:hypothetical protein
MTLPKNEALRDQLLAAIRLRPTGTFLSTDEIGALMPTPTRRYPNGRGGMVGFEIYPHLRILENRGHLERVRYPHDNRVFWKIADDAPQDIETDVDLEQMWTASP